MAALLIINSMLGTLPGRAGDPKNSTGIAAPPTGVELELLRNSLRWLAEKGQVE